MSQEDLERILGGAGGAGGFSDFFELLFGQMGRGRSGANPFGAGGRTQGRGARGQDIEQEVELTLEEAFNGTTRLLQRGDNTTGEVRIPKGVQTGSRVRVSGMGGAGASSGSAGDLFLKITVRPHAVFERRGDDLYATAPVELYTALLGGSVQAPTLTGPVSLTIPAETANGQTIRLRGQGMPTMKDNSQRGDLFVTVQVTLPRQLSAQEIDLFQQLAGLRKTARRETR